LHKILDTRCLPIVMPNRPGNYENPRLELAQELRERLTAWRAKHLHAALPCLTPPDGISGRLWDISRPMLQVGQLVNLEGSSQLIKAILDIAGERNESKRETTEGRLVGIIRELTGEQGYQDLPEWTLKTADILRKFNEDRPEDRHVSAQWIGRKLKSMSLRHRTVNGRSEICLMASEYLTILDQYGCISRESTVEEPNPTQTLPEKKQQSFDVMGVVGSSRVSGQTWEDEAWQEYFEERAAILQFDYGMSRMDAEREAVRLTQEHFSGERHG